ncbi:symmetrical bis(5'-nucleosyl)-tetraphosphatase [Undibacterium fentianense]|uniref:bis(5'-nucleosyl)-tetraphosphatase (symmetrical) n=1 Tax=Undibacterium fentianense TaxID=2828728 RepID=A0A941E728_9BURK|nr:symmetrical bis(5'-nucleosyl)-tetraphosphatase [Undibacterium fentianense]MBR7799913.1 symmetrical bis(5'-nucleosyl)-tetraphosphatase [Undibacterium fentianense]
MANSFVIGDVQGCFDQLLELIERINQVDPTAQLYFAGDLVNRGPKSLDTLRLIRDLGAKANAVLGNHDLHLLAVAQQLRPKHHSDTLDDILNAPDRDELLEWLRHRSLALDIKGHLLVHAGVYPNWTKAMTLSLAHEVEQQLQGENFREILSAMYGNSPAEWRDDWQANDRYRCIINGLTRMRFCNANGAMDFELKEGSGKAPDHLHAWFDLPTRQTQNCTVVFGHWSTLGLVMRDKLISLDTGCVWGGKLSAVRLEDRLILQVDSPQHQCPF